MLEDMGLAIERVLPGTIILVADIECDKRYDAFLTFMREELNATEYNRGAFDFVLKDSELEGWREMTRKMKEIVNLEEDIVYFWDMMKPKGEVYRQLFRSRLG
jgi:hypothetical protein